MLTLVAVDEPPEYVVARHKKNLKELAEQYIKKEEGAFIFNAKAVWWSRCKLCDRTSLLNTFKCDSIPHENNCPLK